MSQSSAPKSTLPENKESNLLMENSTKKEILIDGNYYDVSRWSKFHPGGRVIDYYTKSGEDATIPFLEFHNRSMKRVLVFRNALPFRPQVTLVGDCELDNRNKSLTGAFKQLHQQFDQEGLFDPCLTHVIKRVTECIIYFVMAHSILQNCMDNEYYTTFMRILGIGFLAMAYGRIVWLAHEGGHYSLLGKPSVDAYLQKILYGIGNGLSASWWNHNHHKHHAMPQRIQRDVDLNTLPLVGFNTKCFGGMEIANNFFIRNQAVLFLPFISFIVSIRWSFELHPKYCYYKKQYFELLCIALHFLIGISTAGFVHFLVAKWLWSMYMFGQFSLSHTHLEVTETPKHWVEYAFENTVNVSSTPFMNWWMGFLNFQIEHHLFPTMPEFRGPLIKERVKQFAKENGLPYNELGYWEAVKATITNLNDVSKDAGKLKVM